MLTLLIHLGYLAYDEVTGQARIPNEEIRQEFARVVRDVRRDDTIRRIRESDQLLYNTVEENAEAGGRADREDPCGKKRRFIITMSRRCAV